MEQGGIILESWIYPSLVSSEQYLRLDIGEAGNEWWISLDKNYGRFH